MKAATFTPARVNPVLQHAAERRMSLGGDWRFRLDPDDAGLAGGWANDIGALDQTVQVPGCWQGQGFGGDGKEMVRDFRLEARTFRATYAGTGWYGKSFVVPDDWEGLRLWLNFGGVYPSAEVWLNGTRLGENREPFVPFAFEITELAARGRQNAVAIRVHEAERELGFAYNWQGNWSGLYRDVELTATGACALEAFRVWPDADAETLRLTVRLDGLAAAGQTKLEAVVSQVGHQPTVAADTWRLEATESEFELTVPAPARWSPDTPNLYRIDATLSRDGAVQDALSERFGFVTLDTEGDHFLINGEPYYMRGTGDFMAHPETGSPDTDRQRWRRKLTTLRDYGYNYVRCQSYVPAPEYFDVADEAGLLVQSEMGMLGAWSGHSPWHIYPWPAPTPGWRQKIKSQWDRVVERDANHPSANIYCMSNELYVRHDFPRIAWQCYGDTKRIKPTAMVIWTDGGFHENAPQDFVNTTASNEHMYPKPVIQHEFQWWSSFPDVRLRSRYAGAIRPYAAELAIEAATRHGIAHVLPVAAEKSQRLQLLEAKGKMEDCRRDYPHLAGICHFNAMDTNLSPQGIVDEFYERKVADAPTWRQTNGDTVVFSSLGFDERVLTASDKLRCELSVSDFSHPPLRNPSLQWRLLAGDTELDGGRIDYEHTPYRTCPAGAIEATVPSVAVPMTARLEATLTEGDRSFSNRWDLWFMPAACDLPAGVARHGEAAYTWLTSAPDLPVAEVADLVGGKHRVVITERLDAAVIEFARGGGRVLLMASEGLVRPFPPKFGFKVGHYFFTPPANYPPYEDGHDGTIIADHPMLGAFPHEGFADLQFFRLIGDAPPLELEPLGLNGADPVIRVMHSFPVGRSLGYLTEAKLGAGGIVLIALNLDQALPEARFVLAQICAYAVGGGFAPAMALSHEALAALVAGTALP